MFKGLKRNTQGSRGFPVELSQIDTFRFASRVGRPENELAVFSANTSCVVPEHSSFCMAELSIPRYCHNIITF
jgi:hypothetical protein